MKETSVVHSDPNILGGTPVFVGTRVPVQALIDYIEGGHSLNAFLDDFPTVGVFPCDYWRGAKHTLIAMSRLERLSFNSDRVPRLAAICAQISGGADPLATHRS